MRLCERNVFIRGRECTMGVVSVVVNGANGRAQVRECNVFVMRGKFVSVYLCSCV